MLLYTLEVHAEFATLHVRDLPRATDIAIARAICDRLPMFVRVLRIDLRSVVGLDATVRDGLTALARDWRRERLGHVTFAGAPLDDEPIIAEPRHVTTSTAAPIQAALMATFL
jgi:hypothetical protein